MHRIEQLAQVKLDRMPIPTENDMIKAKNKDILKKLKDVDKEVLNDFDETADILIRE